MPTTLATPVRVTTQPAEWLPVRQALVWEPAATDASREALAQHRALRARLTVAGAAVVDAHRLVAEHPLAATADAPRLLRAALLTTGRGTSIGRTAFDRDAELARSVLAAVGIEPVTVVQPPGHVDGRDVLPAGHVLFQGSGLRSDDDGVGQLLDAGAYGAVEVAVVRDWRREADETTLDDVLALYGPGLAGIADDRLGHPEPTVDVWRVEHSPWGTAYRKDRSLPLLDYLFRRGFDVITFPRDEHRHRAAPTLTVAPLYCLAPDSAGTAFTDRLALHGIAVEHVDSSALPGGPRRQVHVLVRS